MRKIIFILCVILVLSFVNNAQNKIVPTGDEPYGKSQLSSFSGSLSSLSENSSPFRDLPKVSDRVFVRDAQTGALDTGCTFRQDGPLRIVIPINRVITKVDPELNPTDYLNVINKQKQFIYISGKLKIQMPVYDIDPTEQDKVYFNGQYVGTLYGSNNTWVMNYFDVPIEKVKFGKYIDVGTPSVASDNEITIDIDTTNEGWCTAVDWVGASFEAMSPVVLIHGNSSDGQFFTRQGLTEVLGNHKLLYDDKLNFLPKSNYIEDPLVENGNITAQPNNFQLNEHLKKVAKAFGIDSMHLVMHSKGGLDTRSYLSLYQPTNDKLFKILSYTSIGTPHNGSILADIVTERTKVAERADKIEYDDNFPTFARQVFGISGNASLGHYNLTTDYLRNFNQRNIDSISRMNIQFNVTGADADMNRNGAIGLAPLCFANESAELAREGFGVPISNFPTVGVATVMYQAIRDIQTVKVETRTITRNLDGVDVTFTIPKFISTPTASPQVNDTLVSKASSQGIGTFERLINQSSGKRAFYDGCGGANHANIPGKSAVDVITWIWENDLRKGDWER
jgi:pimeloyl-ACP methyl ester carboxylesterase